jgi:LPS-assembly lipoprotein
MSWYEKLLAPINRRASAPRRTVRLAVRVGAICVVAGSTAACFQPLYGDHSLNGQPSLQTALKSVDVQQIAEPNGSHLSRIAVQVRNDLVFNTTGGGETPPPRYRLKINLTQTNISVIVDIATNRPDVQNYGLNASYELVDIKTGKVVVKDQTFSRVSYDTPGEEQRFAAERALREAEDRASQVLADSIRNRLASYFIAGT